jgi:N-acetylmuramoyl-L-alanine amidase
MAIHTVRQGDYLSKITKQYGFADWQTIWNDPQNADLKQKRKNPNVLYPGDQVVIPDKDGKQESGATGQRHRFTSKHRKLMLRLVLKDLDFKPVANAKCVLHVDGQKFELTSQADGLVEHEIQPTAVEARLLVDAAKAPITLNVPIAIGKLDPVDTPSGQKARLNNLGYFAGPLEENDDALFESAVEEFQCDHKLTVDGKCGPMTQARLKDIHGC